MIALIRGCLYSPSLGARWNAQTGRVGMLPSGSGLFVMSLLLGLFGIVLVRLINRLPVLTPWLLVAPVVPTVVYYVYFQVIS